MTFPVSWHPYLLVLSGNLLFFCWAWLGVNGGKGLFYFTTDELGLMFLLPVAVLLNALPWLLAYGRNKTAWARAFGLLLLVLLGGCTSVWIHACATGVSI